MAKPQTFTATVAPTITMTEQVHELTKTLKVNQDQLLARALSWGLLSFYRMYVNQEPCRTCVERIKRGKLP